MQVGTIFTAAPVYTSVTSACNGGCNHSKQDLVQLGDGSSLPDLCPKSVERGNPRPCPLKALIQGRQTAETLAQNLTGIPLSPVLANPNAEITAKLKDMLPEKPFRISAEKAGQLAEKLGISVEQLMIELIPVVKEQARPGVSQYQVGAVGRGPNGDLYLGVNMEYQDQPINATTHGEQYVVNNAYHGKATHLTDLAVSAEPCGHCRQFLNETNKAKDINILIPGKPKTSLKELLVRDFGPQDLGITGALMTPQDNKLTLDGDLDAVTKAALGAANMSYAPYSKSPSGVALLLKGGQIVTGCYLENAAFNPSLPPGQSGMMALTAAHRDYSDIERLVLVEKEDRSVGQRDATESLLRHVAPDAKFEYYTAKQGE